MAKIILKKGERANEPFIADKIRISLEMAARDSGVTEAAAERIVRETYYEVITFAIRRAEVSSTDIRNEIIKILTADPKNMEKNAIAAAWMDYERRFK